jgi:hypothetical protein
MKRRGKPSRPGEKRRSKTARPLAEQPEAPAVITPLHRQDRVVSAAAGAPRAWRRIDRLQWLRDHGTIGDHQLHAGRRLQADWQTSRIESSPRMMLSGQGGGAGGTLSDAALDAGQRVRKAMAVLPGELRPLTELFLMPEDIPFSLERCAAIVKEDRRAAAFGIRVALTLLARHYGYAM